MKKVRLYKRELNPSRPISKKTDQIKRVLA